jgi:hypothetical protein
VAEDATSQGITTNQADLVKPEAGTVVPASGTGNVTDTALEQFRETTLTNPVWNTGLGKGFLGWFWGTWFGKWLTRKFGPDAIPAGTPQELHGYAYWGPVALVITVVEILGALSKSFRNFIPWPTISGTVGHIQDLDGRWGLAVVFVIVATAFAALSSSRKAGPPGKKPLLFGVRYGWPLVLVVTGLTAYLVSIFDPTPNGDPLSKFHLGYAIYGAFAVVGIIIPMMLIWQGSDRVVFPSLFFTLGILRTRFKWIAFAVTAGLAILLVHLALYPWPNLAREPATFAGLNAYHARAAAETAMKNDKTAKDGLRYSAEIRTITHGEDLWLVVFLINGTPTDTPCVVEVSSDGAMLRPDCKQ